MDEFNEFNKSYVAQHERCYGRYQEIYDLEHYLDLSRVVTGEVMAEVFGEWRRARSTCSGGIVWWLNDLVPGGGWGVIDSLGLPKAAYWYLARALAPVAAWTTDEGTNGMALHLANDTASELKATVDVALYRAGGVCCGKGSTEIAMPPQTVLEHSFEGILGHFADAGYAFRFGPPGHDVAVSSLSVGGELLSQSFRYPLGPPAGREPVVQLGLEASVERRGEDDALLLRVRSDAFAYAVNVAVGGFEPDDDFFSIAPGEERTVRLRPSSPGQTWAGGTVRATNALGTVPIRWVP